MYETDFEELSRHTILNVESIVFNKNVVSVVLETTHFRRKTTAPYKFSYTDWKQIDKQGYF